MAKKTKTLAMKVLEGKKVAYKTAVYPKTLRDAEEIAALLQFPPEQVFKTLVVKPPKENPRAKPMLVMIPANRQLNLKLLATAVNAKKLKMASHREAEAMTKLQVGGISPLALLNKGFLIFLDSSAQNLDNIIISAGVKGIQIILPVTDFINVTQARYVDSN